MWEVDSVIRDARRAAVRRMEREMREQRRAYEAELEARGISEMRREELLEELEAEQRRRIRAYEQWFRASLQPDRPVP